jgi:hypothetical protein
MTRQYRIQEFYDYEKGAPHFRIQRTNLLGEWDFTDTPTYDDLELAKYDVKAMKYYAEPRYHYVDEEE